jgi:hypothetical protein
VKLAPQPADQPQAGVSFKVHIDELVLHGFALTDRHKIARAVEVELVRLMSTGGLQGLGKHPLTLERIRGGAFKVTAGAKPQAAGTQIARAVFQGLRQSSRASARAHRARPR